MSSLLQRGEGRVALEALCERSSELVVDETASELVVDETATELVVDETASECRRSAC